MRSSHKSKKKDKKDKKKSKKRSRSDSTSSSSSSSSDDWVEARPEKAASEEEKDCVKSLSDGSNQRDDWMSAPVEFSGYTRDQLKKEKKPKDDENKYMLDRLGRTDRELNPYWKDGGSGLPEEAKDLNVSASAVGDHGVEWLRKALRRAKEQAADENRRLEDVVAERWGSLDKLESMIKEAESRSQQTSNRHSEDKDYKKYRERGGSDYKYDKRREEERYSKYNDRAYQYSKGRDSFKKNFIKPSEDNDDSYSSKKKDFDNETFNREARHKTPVKRFRKPSDDDIIDVHHSKRKEDNFNEKRYSDDSNEDRLRGKRSLKNFLKPSDDYNDKSSISSKQFKKDTSSVAGSLGKGWRKNPQPQTIVQNTMGSNLDEGDMRKNPQNMTENAEKNSVIESSSQSAFLSADERNELAAKLFKAEIMGNTDLVEKLKSQLEEARSVASEAEKTVILTRTDSKGFTQPLSLPSKPEYGRGRKEKTQTHEGGKRVRYFADDDKYSLQEMFEREKRSTVEDQNEMFARLASKNVGRDESAHDMDDVFEEMVRVKESEGKTAARERDRAIEQHRRSSKAFENCQWCLDGKRLLRHLVVTIGSKVFLCLPPYESLTEGHCLLIPTQHVICSTQLDEDVWEELQLFRKALVQMFLSMDMDVVFFECAMNFPSLPHMMWQCVPLPKESGDVAPIYFKKAILECETEWSSNKKLVDLAGKNVRRAIPRGLPYFAVDFGLQSGFAHVIEDGKLFPKNFAQEIIGGMLDVDHRLWRKPKFQKFEEQRHKIIEFTKWWQPFNCITKTSDISNK